MTDLEHELAEFLARKSLRSVPAELHDVRGKTVPVVVLRARSRARSSSESFTRRSARSVDRAHVVSAYVPTSNAVTDGKEQ